MQRWIWIVIAILVSTLVYFTIRYGLNARAIPVMNATEFRDTEEIGIVIYKRLRQNIRAERVVLLGSSANVQDDKHMWGGFIKAAQADGEPLVQFADEETKRESFVQDVNARIRAGHIVIVHGLTPDVSHLVEGSLSKRLEKVVGHPVLTISTLPFAIKSADSDSLQTQCLDATESKTSIRRLDCAAGRVARKNLKKRLAPEKIWAAMERHGLKEYLLFIHRP